MRSQALFFVCAVSLLSLGVSFQGASVFRSDLDFTQRKTRRHQTNLFSIIKKSLSAAERERFEEDERRRKRKDDVVIGKTSAIKGEKDFPLDIKSTEAEYLRQANRVEQEVYKWTTAGMQFLNTLQLEEADEAFSQVFEVKKDTYLWQAGIVKYYLGDYESAAHIFARNGKSFELRFGGHATEERIWRDACCLKHKGSKKKKKDKSTIDFPTIPDPEPGSFFSPEPRKALSVARELFAASEAGDQSEELISRAKLRSLGGNEEATPVVDRKLWKLTSWFYLGLHYDAINNEKESKKCMKMALRLCPSSGKSDDIVHTLPMLHMTARDWFDDDEIDKEITFDDSITEEDGFSPSKPSEAIASMAFADPLLENSIKDGVSKMKRSEMQDALRLRGKTTTGTKEVLRERLFYSLMEDAGFSSGFEP